MNHKSRCRMGRPHSESRLLLLVRLMPVGCLPQSGLPPPVQPASPLLDISTEEACILPPAQLSQRPLLLSPPACWWGHYLPFGPGAACPHLPDTGFESHTGDWPPPVSPATQPGDAVMICALFTSCPWGRGYWETVVLCPRPLQGPRLCRGDAAPDPDTRRPVSVLEAFK